MQADHVSKRQTTIGRWLPLSIYSLNFALWIVTGILAGVWDLLWLAFLPLPALSLYLFRTRKESE